MPLVTTGGQEMAARGATRDQKEADRMDLLLFNCGGTAQALGWRDVAAALSEARTALLPRMHPKDREIAVADQEPA